VAQSPVVAVLVIAQAVAQDRLELANVRVFIPSAAPVSSTLIGWFSRLETSPSFATNHVREWFSCSTV